MSQPHEDRQVGTHKVAGNERPLLTPMLKKERDELREVLDILEAHLGTGAWQYTAYSVYTYDPDPEDRTRPSCVKKTMAARVLRSVSTKKVARSQEHGVMDLDAKESVAEQVARLLTHQAGARAGSSPETHRMIRQSPWGLACLPSLQAVA